MVSYSLIKIAKTITLSMVNAGRFAYLVGQVRKKAARVFLNGSALTTNTLGK